MIKKGMTNDEFRELRFFIITLAAISIFLFSWIGFHNTDLAVNVLKISYDNGINLFYGSCDMNALGNCLSYPKIYSTYGVSFMNMAIIAQTLLLFYVIYEYRMLMLEIKNG